MNEQIYSNNVCQKVGDTEAQSTPKFLQLFANDVLGENQINEWYNSFKYGLTSV